MENQPNFREPQEKKIIIDDLASYEEEIGAGRGVRRRGGIMDFVKSVFVFLLLVGIVVGSFWVSFLIGKRVLVPVKTLETRELSPIIENITIEEDPTSMIVTSEAEIEKINRSVPSKRIVLAEEQMEAVKYYKVQAGLFTSKTDAEKLVSELKANGVSGFVRKVSSQAWRVQVGAYRTKPKAQVMLSELKAKGFSGTIIYE